MTKVGNGDLWFQLHRVAMASSCVFTLVAVIVIFAERRGWSKSAGSHAITGIILFAIALINPTVAMFRPSPTSGMSDNYFRPEFSVINFWYLQCDSEHRVYFNYFHHLMGYLALVLGHVTIFLGFDLTLFDLDFVATQLFVSVIAISSISSIALEFSKDKLENYYFFNVKVYAIVSFLYFLFLFVMAVVILHQIVTFTPTV